MICQKFYFSFYHFIYRIFSK